MRKTEYEALLTEAIKPKTSRERCREIGKRLLMECGEERLTDALALLKRARVSVGIEPVVVDIGYDPIEDAVDVTVEYRQKEAAAS